MERKTTVAIDVKYAMVVKGDAATVEAEVMAARQETRFAVVQRYHGDELRTERVDPWRVSHLRVTTPADVDTYEKEPE